MDSFRLYYPSKRLGQNFLKDPEIASRIVSAAQLTRRDTVLEPGAGFGTLTELLEKVAGRVFAVEKDRRLATYLQAKFRESSTVEIIEGDILKTPLPSYNRVVGTPPYNISSKLILYLISSNFEASHIVFQKEFGQRLLARPGTSNYGRLSVVVQRKLRIKSIMEVPRDMFHPKPKVDSILLRLEPKPTSRTGVDELAFSELIRGVFVQRRRLVKGALRHYLEQKVGRDSANQIVKSLEMPDARVYELSVDQFENLASQLTALLRIGK